MRLITSIILSLAFVLMGAAGRAQIQFSVEGTDFWFSLMPNIGTNSPPSDSVLLTISSRYNTSGIIENSAFGFSIPFTVNAFEVTEIPLPNDVSTTLESQVIDSTSIHIISDDTITAFVASMQPYTRDATNLIPTPALGKEYMISSYAYEGSFSYSEFVIVATEDDTQVRITPTAVTSAGNLPGVPFVVNLERGQTYLVQVDTAGQDLSGTIVTTLDSGTACNNIAVFAGSTCTNLPGSGCGACDHVFSVLPPTLAWGNEYLVAPFDLDSLSTYRIMALRDNSPIYIDGSIVTTLNSGEFFEVNHDSIARCISSDSTILVTQFMQGVMCSTNGDPAMLIINATSQGVTQAIFNTIDVASDQDTNFATIITSQDGIDDLVFNGTPLDSNIFIQFPFCSEYYYAYLTLDTGTHILTSTTKFSLYVYGMTNADSYAYSAGAVIPVKGEILDVSCATSRARFTGDTALAGGWWHPLTSYSDTLSTNLVLVLTAPITPGIYVYSGFSAISGCREDRYFSVEDPRTNLGLLAETSETMVCPGEEVTLSFIQREETWFADFEDSLSSALFSSFQGVQTSDVCGSLVDDALLFRGAFLREVTTSDINTTSGGYIQFWASANTPCDQPDPTDTVMLEYSTNSGTDWQAIDSLLPADYADFLRYRRKIPAAAQTLNTRFRLRQAGAFASNQDIWAVDEWSIFVSNSAISDSLRWTPKDLVSDSMAISPQGKPVDSTYFTVFVRDSIGCEFSDSVLVVAVGELQDPEDADTSICLGQTIPFTASEGAIFQWSPTDGVNNPEAQSVLLQPDVDTEYAVKIKDAYGCDSVIQTVLIDVRFPFAIGNFDDTLLCNNAIIYYAVPDTGTTVEWSTGSSADVIAITKSGKYWYTTVNECGSVTDTMLVKAAPLVIVDLGPDLRLCPGQRHEVVLDSAFQSFIWSDDNRSPKRVFDAPGTYAVTVTDSLGCQNWDTLILFDDCLTSVVYPNVFTPNGDGVNDAFSIDIEYAKDIYIGIFNRWGLRVFSSNSGKAYWDGTSNGQPATEGVYFLEITFTDRDNRQQQHKGSITLLRE